MLQSRQRKSTRSIADALVVSNSSTEPPLPLADGRGFFYSFFFLVLRKERTDTTHATKSTRTPAAMIIKLINSYNVISPTSLLLVIDQEAIRPVTGAFLDLYYNIYSQEKQLV